MRSLTLGIVRFLWSGWVWKSGVSFSFRHVFFYLSLVAGNAFKRQISVSGDLLLWLRIAFGGVLFWHEKKTSYNIFWDYSFIVERRRRCFAEAGFDHGSSGLRCFFTFETMRWWGSKREPRFQTFPFPESLFGPFRLPRSRQAPALSHLCMESFGFPIAMELIIPITGLLWQQLLSCLETDLKGFSSSFGLFGTYTEIERAAIGTVLLLLKAQILKETRFGSNVCWTGFLDDDFSLFGRNQYWEYISAAASSMRRVFNRI